MKLNLGSGVDYRQGWHNVDCGPFRVDQSLDVFAPLPWPTGSVEEIHARDILEHETWERTEEVLKEWVRVLAPGGLITIQVPNLRVLCEKYLDGSLDAKKASFWIFGGHSSGHGLDRAHWRLNAHYAGFDEARLRQLADMNRLEIVQLGGDGGSNLIFIGRKR